MTDQIELHIEEPEPTRGVKVFGAVVWCILTFIIFCVCAFTLAQVWPYNQANIEQASGIMSEVKTSEGVPVIYPGQDIRYTVNLCNYGVDITADRWLDSYGPILPETENVELGRDRRTNSELIRETIFFEREEIGCIDDVRVAYKLPAETQAGVYYKVRTNNRYSPNFLTEVNNVTETDLFYYAEEGQEIP